MASWYERQTLRDLKKLRKQIDILKDYRNFSPTFKILPTEERELVQQQIDEMEAVEFTMSIRLSMAARREKYGTQEDKR